MRHSFHLQWVGPQARVTRNRAERIAVVLFSAMLAACAATGPRYEDAPPPPPGQALVYIFRPSNSSFGARDITLSLGNLDVADLNNNGYTWLHVPAGEYMLRQRWPRDMGRKALELDVFLDPGKQYYYKFESWYDAGYINWKLSQLNAASALPFLRNCRYQPAVGAAKMKEKPPKTENDIRLEELRGLIPK